nr:NAD(P)/FAD-dependent oxidoreductase [Clostridia bacterium]
KIAKEKGWYEDLKEYCQKCVIDILNESIFDGFKTKVTEATCSTPITIEKVTNGFEGSITGWAFSNNMPVQSELTKIAKAIYTEIPNVYKAGQWSFYPSGIPTCIITGKLAADNIKKKMRK